MSPRCSLQPHTRTRAYADVHAGSGRNPSSESASAPRGPPAPQGVIRSASHRSGREGNQRDPPRDRAVRRRREGSRPGTHRLPRDAPRPRGPALLEARRGRPHQLLALHRVGVRGPEAHRGLVTYWRRSWPAHWAKVMAALIDSPIASPAGAPLYRATRKTAARRRKEVRTQTRATSSIRERGGRLSRWDGSCHSSWL